MVKTVQRNKPSYDDKGALLGGFGLVLGLGKAGIPQEKGVREYEMRKKKVKGKGERRWRSRRVELCQAG